jgi:MFS superfamily sulfate permease-like transporter
VVAIGVEQGILLAMVVSLLRIVHHSYHPRSGVMVPSPDGTFNLLDTTPGLETEPGLVLYRFGSALFYANVGRFVDEIMLLVGPTPSPVHWLIVDAEAITHIDYSAARTILQLQKNLVAAGITFGFARVPWDAKADFERHHLAGVIDPALLFNRLADAQNAFHKAQLDRSGPTT